MTNAETRKGDDTAVAPKSNAESQLKCHLSGMSRQYWDIVRECLSERMQPCCDAEGNTIDDEYEVSKMSDQELMNFSMENYDWLRSLLLDDRKSIKEDKRDIQENQVKIASLWSKFPDPFRFLVKDPDKTAPLDFPPDLDRLTLALHERYPHCDWQSPLVSACLSRLCLSQTLLQDSFMPLLEQAVTSEEFTSGRDSFHSLIQAIIWWQNAYDMLNDVCRISQERGIISKAISEMERVHADCSFLKEELTKKEDETISMLKDLAGKQFTRKDAFGVVRDMQNGDRVKDNGPRGMTKNDFVKVFREVFTNQHLAFGISNMPFLDQLRGTTHDPIVNAFKNIINAEEYKRFVRKGSKSPHYYRIDDLCEAIEMHCEDRGYEYTVQRVTEKGIGRLIDLIREEAENSLESVNLASNSFEEKK